jgi:hypothetical protein
MADPARGSISTILFTDVVDSTVLMQRLGDERAQRVFERHHLAGHRSTKATSAHARAADTTCCVVRSRLFDRMRVRLRNTLEAIRG